MKRRLALAVLLCYCLVMFLWFPPSAWDSSQSIPPKVAPPLDLTQGFSSPQHVRVHRPANLLFPDKSDVAIVYDAWFRTPLELFLIVHYHPNVNYAQLQVTVDGNDATGRFKDYGRNPNGRHLVYQLRHPVAAKNMLKLSFGDVTATHYNLDVLSLLPVTAELVHTTLFMHDFELLDLAYKYYTAQGFTRFIWAYNGVIDDAVLAKIPAYPNLELVEWNYAYSFRIPTAWQHAQICWLTYTVHRILPQSEWVASVDFDEFLAIRTGERIADAISSRPLKQMHIFRNRFAEVPSDWKEVHLNSESPSLKLRLDADLFKCPDRAKTLYHRSFLDNPLPVIGAHAPEPFVPGFCPDGFENIHVLNFREGHSTAKVKIENFLPEPLVI
jgi:hypothetical protein